jgi:lipoprotein-anchoring transpeptidase ErfK/SrfK
MIFLLIHFILPKQQPLERQMFLLRVFRRPFTVPIGGVQALFFSFLGFYPTNTVAQDFFPFLDEDPPSHTRTQEIKIRQSVRSHTERAVDRAERKEEATHSLKVQKSKENDIKQAPVVKNNLPLFAVVSVADQHISIYDHNGLVARSMVSTGIADHPTPKGIFTILGRERFHQSNIYSGAPMPFMQRITWSGIAMHTGVVPGHPASHGCIRLPAEFASKLWGMTRVGERVVISPREVTPHEFNEPFIITPKMQTISEPMKSDASNSVNSEKIPQEKTLNPYQYAEQMKVRAVNEVLAANKDLKEAIVQQHLKGNDVALLTADLKKAQTEVAAIQSKLSGYSKIYDEAVERAKIKSQEAEQAKINLKEQLSGALPQKKIDLIVKASEKAIAYKEAALTDKTKNEEALSAAKMKLDNFTKLISARSLDLSEADRRLSELTNITNAAKEREKLARQRMAPLSVMISRRDQKIYVRQGLVPVFDGPVTIRDMGAPLGEHLYIATAATEDGKSLKWSALSLPPSDKHEVDEVIKVKLDSRSQINHQLFDSNLTSNASEALGRIEISQDVRDRLGERLWVGSSMIISDQSPSSETGNDGTDLTVKIR